MAQLFMVPCWLTIHQWQIRLMYCHFSIVTSFIFYGFGDWFRLCNAMEFNHLIVFCWFLMILSYVSTEPKDNEEPCFQQRVLHISLLKGRVFLSVVTACGHGPTFLETQWINKPKEYRTFQENSGDLISQAFPNPSRHQIINDPCYPIRCSLIQQARWSQVDEKNGPRLWLLDLGKRFSLMTPTKYTCPSKLIVFYIGEGQRREEKVWIIKVFHYPSWKFYWNVSFSLCIENNIGLTAEISSYFGHPIKIRINWSIQYERRRRTQFTEVLL